MSRVPRGKGLTPKYNVTGPMLNKYGTIFLTLPNDRKMCFSLVGRLQVVTAVSIRLRLFF